MLVYTSVLKAYQMQPTKNLKKLWVMLKMSIILYICTDLQLLSMTILKIQSDKSIAIVNATADNISELLSTESIKIVKPGVELHGYIVLKFSEVL